MTCIAQMWLLLMMAVGVFLAFTIDLCGLFDKLWFISILGFYFVWRLFIAIYGYYDRKWGVKRFSGRWSCLTINDGKQHGYLLLNTDHTFELVKVPLKMFSIAPESELLINEKGEWTYIPFDKQGRSLIDLMILDSSICKLPYRVSLIYDIIDSKHFLGIGRESICEAEPIFQKHVNEDGTTHN